ncbi:MULTISPECIES: right-handed parallel beta-helix repeat-containing protein [Haloferacaceae]|uniref:Right-handed parallel beta-helix repeat-containing protein n=1 Tax=Halorubrum glutamatedens TaxID=2707018 RepID=A0ABD5QS86_9EURY|nr:right-handed parallel beta-helix repeat-containing protein [Halobellus captivus]
MDSKSDHGERENSSERPKNGGAVLLDRRKYLRLGAVAVGAVGTGTGTALASSTGSAERNGIEFGRVLNADEDLGIADGDRVDEVLGGVANEGDALVRFPPGEYLVGDSVRLRADDFGIESTTGDREDVVFKPVSGTDPIMFEPDRDQSGFYVGSVTLDRRDEWDSSMTLMRGIFSDKVYVTDLLVNGWAPHGGEQLLIFSITDPEGSALVDGVTRRGPSQFPEYPSTTLTIFNGPSSKGSITYRNLEIHNATESGIYAGKSYGPIRVEDSYFKNCSHSAVRVTGEDSWIKNTTVVMDLDDLHPDAEVKDPKGIQLNRGIWVQSGDHEHNGPLIENCDIRINSAENGIAGIMNNDDSGGMTVRNTRVECNQDGIYPVLIQAEATEKAGTPYESVLDDVSVTGSGSGRPAIEIRERDGTTVKNSCIRMPNTDGIRFEGTSDATLQDTNVNVGGRATMFESADVTTTNLTSDESCPAPALDSWRDDGSDSTEETDTSDESDSAEEDSTEEDSTDGSGSEPVTSGNRVVIAQTREGEVVRYDLTASEGLESGEYATEEPEGDTASGRTGRLRGVDDFHVDGHLTAFSGSNLDYATVYFADDGVELEVDNYVLQNPEDLREADPTVLGENVLTVESDDDTAIDYEFSASGDVVPGATGDGATIEDEVASGSTTDRSAFHFTGSLDEVAVTDPDTVTVTVNGAVLDGDDLSTLGGTSEDQETSGNRVVIAQTREGEVVRYDLTASEGLESGEYATEEPEGDTASGRTGRLRGVDDFHVDGHLTAFSGSNLDYATVYFADDGVELEVDNYVLQNPEDLREADPTVLGENVLTVESDDDHASGFEFSASGDVVPGVTGDGATIEDGVASGSTTDRSAFHFTGSLDEIAVTDPDTVTVTVNGAVLDGDDLATLGEEDDLPNTLSVVGNGDATSYEFTVSGEIAAGSSSTDDVEDNVSDSSAEGAIEDGTHVYGFSGVVTSLTVTGGVEVYRNGELIGNTDGSEELNLMEFDGSKSNEVCSYQFSASGEVSKSDEHSTQGAGKWDSLESKADEDSVVGIVHRGVDAYWFTGSIDELELRGSAVATFRTIE